MINCEKIIDSINVGILTIDADLNIHYMNKWFTLHSEIHHQKGEFLNILDIFKLSDEHLKSLKRHIKTALTLNGPSFYTADSNHFIFPMKHAPTTKSIFEFMQQDVTIIPYDIEKKQVTLLIYDQTTLMEEKARCYKESDALANANEIANATIKKLQSAKNKLVKQQDIIYKQAHYDQLTSLANRTLLHERFQVSIEKALENNEKFGVLFLDLDNFKETNDTLGHDTGDALLIHVAKLLLHETRKTDTVARLGGDEFIILVDDIEDEKILSTIATKIISSIAQPTNLNNHMLQATASIGISIYPTHGEDFNALLKSADMALYKAKADGRNNYKLGESHGK